MTPRREALLAYGVLRKNVAPPGDLARDNIDQDKLKQFARTVAESFGLPSYCQFVTDGTYAMKGCSCLDEIGK